MATVILHDYKEALDWIFSRVDSHIRLATPLGLGKPNQLLNQIFDHVAGLPKYELDIYTALSLTIPSTNQALGKRFLKPFIDQHWGKDYPALKYSTAAVRDQLPKNIRVHEFYFQSGLALKSESLQRHYESVNYTHVIENLRKNNINVIVQMIAGQKGSSKYSLSCNPDLTLDLVDAYKEAGKPLLKIGVKHPDLPYLSGESEVDTDFFDLILDSPETKHELFSLPREPLTEADLMIGFHASQLVPDDGTIQVGIGALSEAIGWGLVLRQKENSRYLKLIDHLNTQFFSSLGVEKWSSVFDKGLYGLSEMVTDVFMHLRLNGLLKRHVIDEVSGNKTYLHGAFYLGSKVFYQWLRDLNPSEMLGLRMTRVSKINDLYDPNELLLRAQRKNARFFNTSMQMTLLGEAMSETLSDARVVSGIGGQYNFVAMSMELKKSRSILFLRSTYQAKNQILSNIIWEPGHVSIPRHLRDLVVTEYGIADLRGRSDEDCIKAMLNICDSRFQLELLNKAKASKKISADYIIPEQYRGNFPEKIADIKKIYPDLFKSFPFGSDWTEEEERIALALQKLKQASVSKLKILSLLMRGFSQDKKLYEKELKRMNLESPSSISGFFNQKLLLGAFR